MSKIVYPLRFDDRTIEGVRQAAEAEGESIAVIIRRYVNAGLERDGYYMPPGPPKRVEARHAQHA